MYMYMTVYDRWNTHISDTCIQIQEVSKKNLKKHKTKQNHVASKTV